MSTPDLHQQAEQYLEAIASPLAPSGVHVYLEKDAPDEFHYLLVAGDSKDFGTLIGKKGGTVEAIRQVFSAWLSVHAPTRRGSVLVPNERQIEPTYQDEFGTLDGERADSL